MSKIITFFLSNFYRLQNNSTFILNLPNLKKCTVLSFFFSATYSGKCFSIILSGITGKKDSATLIARPTSRENHSFNSFVWEQHARPHKTAVPPQTNSGLGIV